MSKHYQVCTRCVMDTSAVDILFDEKGICSYCTEFLERSAKVLFMDESQRTIERNSLIGRIKEKGIKSEYDCIIGVSGGVDSSWALYQAVKLGLRPLAVHMDNGWNSELAQHNIHNLVNKLDVDLFTYVVNWEEYKALQQAFFDADVIDVELLYDNAASGVCFRQANKIGTKFILGGTNQSTEGMKMPPSWNWYKKDKRNIKSIYKMHGKGNSINSFPFISTIGSYYYRLLKGIKWVSFLDYFYYDKNEALTVLQSKLDYRPYPYKHYESVFTRFYQGYILPMKFGIDKRKLHLSSLIVSLQMSRADVLNLLNQKPYHSQSELEQDKEYFLKKMGWTSETLSLYIKREPKPHSNYASEWDFKKRLSKLFNPQRMAL